MYLNFVYILEGVWRVLMKKKRGGNRKKRFYSEMQGCESHVGLSMCDNPMEAVFIKRWVPLER